MPSVRSRVLVVAAAVLVAVVVALAAVGVLGTSALRGGDGGTEPSATAAGGSSQRAEEPRRDSEAAPVTEVAESGAEPGDRLPGITAPRAVPRLDGLPAAPAGARVLSRSRTGSGTSAQLTLTGTTSRAPATVLAHYGRALGRNGLVGSPIDAVPGSTAVRFARGADTVVLTTRRTAGATGFTVVAALHPTRG